jgi:SNF2 family DNA or RNA helicase
MIFLNFVFLFLLIQILLWEIFLDAKAERDNAVTDSSVFLKLKFARIVLDEGHKIRNHKTETAEAVFKLEASCRWVLSGTPIQNTEMDLFSLFKFLRVSPFDQLEVSLIFSDLFCVL